MRRQSDDFRLLVSLRRIAYNLVHTDGVFCFCTCRDHLVRIIDSYPKLVISPPNLDFNMVFRMDVTRFV